jgi:hypothetical protein
MRLASTFAVVVVYGRPGCPHQQPPSSGCLVLYVDIDIRGPRCPPCRRSPQPAVAATPSHVFFPRNTRCRRVPASVPALTHNSGSRLLVLGLLAPSVSTPAPASKLRRPTLLPADRGWDTQTHIIARTLRPSSRIALLSFLSMSSPCSALWPPCSPRRPPTLTSSTTAPCLSATSAVA